MITNGVKIVKSSKVHETILERLKEAKDRAAATNTSNSVLYQEIVIRCLKSILSLEIIPESLELNFLDLMLELLFCSNTHVTTFCLAEDLLRDKITGNNFYVNFLIRSLFFYN
jgi:hypothetical protein